LSAGRLGGRRHLSRGTGSPRLWAAFLAGQSGLPGRGSGCWWRWRNGWSGRASEPRGHGEGAAGHPSVRALRRPEPGDPGDLPTWSSRGRDAIRDDRWRTGRVTWRLSEARWLPTKGLPAILLSPSVERGVQVLRARWRPGSTRRWPISTWCTSTPCSRMPRLGSRRGLPRRGVPYVVRPLGSRPLEDAEASAESCCCALGAKQMLRGAAAMHYTTAEERRLWRARSVLDAAHSARGCDGFVRGCWRRPPCPPCRFRRMSWCWRAGSEEGAGVLLRPFWS